MAEHIDSLENELKKLTAALQMQALMCEEPPSSNVLEEGGFTNVLAGIKSLSLSNLLELLKRRMPFFQQYFVQLEKNRVPHHNIVGSCFEKTCKFVKWVGKSCIGGITSESLWANLLFGTIWASAGNYFLAGTTHGITIGFAAGGTLLGTTPMLLKAIREFDRQKLKLVGSSVLQEKEAIFAFVTHYLLPISLAAIPALGSLIIFSKLTLADNPGKFLTQNIISCGMMSLGALLNYGWCFAMPRLLHRLLRNNQNFVSNISSDLKKILPNLEDYNNNRLVEKLKEAPDSWGETMRNVATLLKFSFATSKSNLINLILAISLKTINKANLELEKDNYSFSLEYRTTEVNALKNLIYERIRELNMLQHEEVENEQNLTQVLRDELGKLKKELEYMKKELEDLKRQKNFELDKLDRKIETLNQEIISLQSKEKGGFREYGRIEQDCDNFIQQLEVTKQGANIHQKLILSMHQDQLLRVKETIQVITSTQLSNILAAPCRERQQEFQQFRQFYSPDIGQEAAVTEKWERWNFEFLLAKEEELLSENRIVNIKNQLLELNELLKERQKKMKRQNELREFHSAKTMELDSESQGLSSKRRNSILRWEEFEEPETPRWIKEMRLELIKELQSAWRTVTPLLYWQDDSQFFLEKLHRFLPEYINKDSDDVFSLTGESVLKNSDLSPAVAMRTGISAEFGVATLAVDSRDNSEEKKAGAPENPLLLSQPLSRGIAQPDGGRTSSQLSSSSSASAAVEDLFRVDIKR